MLMIVIMLSRLLVTLGFLALCGYLAYVAVNTASYLAFLGAFATGLATLLAFTAIDAKPVPKS
jgi:hypothetical protein